MTADTIAAALEEARKQKDPLIALQARIKQIQAEKENIHSLDPSREAVSGGETTDISRKLEKFERDCMRALNRAAAEEKRRERKVHRARALINRCTDDTAWAILTDWYINGLSWETIGRLHHYSRSNLDKIRKRGIRLIACSFRGKLRRKKSGQK